MRKIAIGDSQFQRLPVVKHCWIWSGDVYSIYKDWTNPTNYVILNPSDVLIFVYQLQITAVVIYLITPSITDNYMLNIYYLPILTVYGYVHYSPLICGTRSRFQRRIFTNMGGEPCLYRVQMWHNRCKLDFYITGLNTKQKNHENINYDYDYKI